MMLEKIEGRVIWFDPKKGYGFIEYEGRFGEKREAFVHYSKIKADGFRTLETDQKVEFTIAATSRGDQALDVKIL